MLLEPFALLHIKLEFHESIELTQQLGWKIRHF